MSSQRQVVLWVVDICQFVSVWGHCSNWTRRHVAAFCVPHAQQHDVLSNYYSAPVPPLLQCPHCACGTQNAATWCLVRLLQCPHTDTNSHLSTTHKTIMSSRHRISYMWGTLQGGEDTYDASDIQVWSQNAHLHVSTTQLSATQLIIQSSGHMYKRICTHAHLSTTHNPPLIRQIDDS